MLRRNLGPILWTSALVTVLGLAAAPARADDMFLQLGDIQGESTARGYERWIDVVSWSWGVSNPATFATAGTGLSAGRATLSDLNLMKFADSATPRLLVGAAQGTHFPKATLAVRRASDGFEYLRIRLEDVMVSSDQLSAGGDRPAESVGPLLRPGRFRLHPEPRKENRLFRVGRRQERFLHPAPVAELSRWITPDFGLSSVLDIIRPADEPQDNG